MKPDISLERAGSSLLEFSTGCRQQFDAFMASRDWSLVIVLGDTVSAFLGALTVFYNRVPAAHVEAGLRTYDLARPFPEEGLRQMISRLVQFHFCPTPRAPPDLQVLFPVHLNPVIQAPVHAILDGIDNITLVPPLDYPKLSTCCHERLVGPCRRAVCRPCGSPLLLRRARRAYPIAPRP